MSRRHLTLVRTSAPPTIKAGTLTIHSAHSTEKLMELRANRERYEAACHRAYSLYSVEKTPEWRAACDHAKALSKTFPLTIAKRKLNKSGLIVYGDDE